MGQRASIIATPAAQADALLAALHLARSDEPDPDNHQPFSCGILGDHFILWRNWRKARPHGPFPHADLTRASGQVPLLVLDVCETTMSSCLRRFVGGRLCWGAEANDGDEKPQSVTGPVPEQIAQAAAENRAAQAADPDVSDFEVPVRAFELLTGHRYDAVDDVAYVTVRSTLPPRRPFWKLWG